MSWRWPSRRSLATFGGSLLQSCGAGALPVGPRERAPASAAPPRRRPGNPRFARPAGRGGGGDRRAGLRRRASRGHSPCAGLGHDRAWAWVAEARADWAAIPRCPGERDSGRLSLARGWRGLPSVGAEGGAGPARPNSGKTARPSASPCAEAPPPAPFPGTEARRRRGPGRANRAPRRESPPAPHLPDRRGPSPIPIRIKRGVWDAGSRADWEGSRCALWIAATARRRSRGLPRDEDCAVIRGTPCGLTARPAHPGYRRCRSGRARECFPARPRLPAPAAGSRSSAAPIFSAAAACDWFAASACAASAAGPSATASVCGPVSDRASPSASFPSRSS